MAQGISEAIGIDLGDRWSHVHAIAAETGEVLGVRRVRTTVEELAKLFGGLAPTRVVIETGTHANWVARLASRHGHAPLVAQARCLRVIYQNPRKSDALDAQMLAELGSTHPHLLHPVQVRDEVTQADLAVLRARETLVEGRTRIVSSVRGMVKSLGHRLPTCDAAHFARRAREACPPALRPAVLPLLESVETISAQIAELDGRVVELATQRYARQTRPLVAIPGVGVLTALAFVLVVGDPRRFRRNRDVGAYLGLVPRRDQSGSSDPQLGITRCGDRLVRRLLVQCAHVMLRTRGQDCDLRRWGLARAARGGKASKKRAVVAVARRLAVMMLALLRSGADYEPLRLASRRTA